MGDVTTAYYDEYRQIWVLFVKRHVIVLGQQRRCVGLMASKDFVNWSPPRSMFVPDYRDDAGSLGRAQRVQALLDMPISPNLLNTQYYGTGAYAAESCAVAFPWIFTMSNGGETSSKGPIEIQLAASRDLVNWERHFRTPCIPTGAAGEWDSGLFYTQSQAFRHNDEVLALLQRLQLHPRPRNRAPARTRPNKRPASGWSNGNWTALCRRTQASRAAC